MNEVSKKMLPYRRIKCNALFLDWDLTLFAMSLLLIIS